MKKNTDGLLDLFQSTGSNIKNFLNRDYIQSGITKNDLIDMNVQSLPSTIAIASEGQKSVYFVES